MVYSKKGIVAWIFFCITTFSQGAFGMKDSDLETSKSPALKITSCLEKLRECFNEHKFNYDLIDEEERMHKQLHILPENLQNYDFLPLISMEDFNELYSSVEYINSGGIGRVFSAILKQDRPEIKAGSKIALKIQSAENPSDDLPAYFLTEKVNSMTPYYSKLFGAYISPVTEGLLRKWSNTPINDQRLNVVFEMEFVETTFRKQFNDPENSNIFFLNIIPDSVIFESFIGCWSLPFYANGVVRDPKSCNLGLQLNINYSRCYNINNEYYLVEDSVMPVRIDIAELQIGKSLQNAFNINNPDKASGNCGKEFILAFKDSSRKPLESMELLKKYFQKFNKTKEVLEENSLKREIRYFKIKY
jgi:hypothetical protein